MGIEEYFSQIKALVDKYAAASFVISANITFDNRPGEQGFLSGTIQFVDHTKLHFREYLDAASENFEKVMYSYHFQDDASKMILRYDNSAHRPALASAEHKHDSKGVQAAEAPRLEDVIAEITALRRWT